MTASDGASNKSLYISASGGDDAFIKIASPTRPFSFIVRLSKVFIFMSSGEFCVIDQTKRVLIVAVSMLETIKPNNIKTMILLNNYDLLFEEDAISK